MQDARSEAPTLAERAVALLLAAILSVVAGVGALYVAYAIVILILA